MPFIPPILCPRLEDAARLADPRYVAEPNPAAGRAGKPEAPKTATGAGSVPTATGKTSESKAVPAAYEKVTSEHLPKGALVETKKGKKGVVTHHDMKPTRGGQPETVRLFGERVLPAFR